MTGRPTAAAGRSAIVAAIVTGIVAVIGLLPLFSGRDAALTVLRARSTEREPDAEALAAVRRELGLDAGPFGLLRQWFEGVVRGDLGQSWVSREPVGARVADALGVSATLTAFAVLIALAVAALLVARTLVRAVNGRRDDGGNGVATVLAGVPEFVIGALFVVLFAVRLRWLPTSGWNGLGNAVLPSVALGIPAGAVLGVIARDAVRDAASAPWLRSWTAAGMRRRVIGLAVLRRAASVVAEQLGLLFAGLFGGAAAVEVVFAVPGIGRLAINGAIAQDVPVVQACVLVILVVGVVASGIGKLAARLLLGPVAEAGALTAAPPAPGSPSRPWLWICAATVAIAAIGCGLSRDPFAVDLSSRLRPPSLTHPIGTDALGRDMLARLSHGAMHTALLALAVTATTAVIGVLVGLAAKRASTSAALVNALPPVVVALVVAAATGPGWAGAVAAVVATGWAPLAGHARSLAAEQHSCGYLTASRALGASSWHLTTRHVLPAIVPPVVRNACVRVPAVALALATLGYLGLGAQPPEPEWGLLIAEGMPYVERAPWTVLFPAAGLIALGLGATSLAIRVR
ncbi:ABC transporter permease subunit [Lentzea sp. BCCO 10_0798]|uniref:ABC transporter permease subunit n=1 Tax=Lentzea kristufekii TaxID=3095430 RepID=A0ABU4U4Q4_9PSEU|nr:ABC transporter permease subunit [Lentzea sp. BCCO 10_0798]MDX8055092.1 ABC transporter permease subunit [Lentzea sp. BCCO 10_0798]